jgi:ERO1-like protein alpha
MPFDEGRLWKDDGAAELKATLQATFQNITRVMDCVGCEKCKLWGKLQTLGEHSVCGGGERGVSRVA